MLMPAAVLIVLVMAAITVDRTLIFADQRDLVATAQAAADDAAAVGLDVVALRDGAAPRFDPVRVGREIDRVIALREEPGRPIAVRWRIEDDHLVVELRRDVPRLFTAVVPGTAGSVEVHARARARLAPTGTDP